MRYTGGGGRRGDSKVPCTSLHKSRWNGKVLSGQIYALRNAGSPSIWECFPLPQQLLKKLWGRDQQERSLTDNFTSDYIQDLHLLTPWNMFLSIYTIKKQVHFFGGETELLSVDWRVAIILGKTKPEGLFHFLTLHSSHPLCYSGFHFSFFLKINKQTNLQNLYHRFSSKK